MKDRSLHSLPLNKLKFVVVDTETTGMYPKTNKVVDIGVVTVKNNKITRTWETLLDPKEKIPAEITYFTNIKNQDVEGKKTFEQIVKPLENKFSNSVFVAHNVNFDYSFLKYEYMRLGLKFDMPKLCTVKLGRKLLPYLDYANLDALSKYFGIKIEGRHRALPDAIATAQIFLKFLEIAQEKYGARNFYDLEKLQGIKINRLIAKGLKRGIL